MHRRTGRGSESHPTGRRYVCPRTPVSGAGGTRSDSLSTLFSGRHESNVTPGQVRAGEQRPWADICRPPSPPPRTVPSVSGTPLEWSPFVHERRTPGVCVRVRRSARRLFSDAQTSLRVVARPGVVSRPPVETGRYDEWLSPVPGVVVLRTRCFISTLGHHGRPPSPLHPPRHVMSVLSPAPPETRRVHPLSCVPQDMSRWPPVEIHPLLPHGSVSCDSPGPGTVRDTPLPPAGPHGRTVTDLRRVFRVSLCREGEARRLVSGTCLGPRDPRGTPVRSDD